MVGAGQRQRLAGGRDGAKRGGVRASHAYIGCHQLAFGQQMSNDVARVWAGVNKGTQPAPEALEVVVADGGVVHITWRHVRRQHLKALARVPEVFDDVAYEGFVFYWVITFRF